MTNPASTVRQTRPRLVARPHRREGAAQSLDDPVARIRDKLTRKLIHCQRKIIDAHIQMRRHPGLVVNVEPYLTGVARFQRALDALADGDFIRPAWLTMPE